MLLRKGLSISKLALFVLFYIGFQIYQYIKLAHQLLLLKLNMLYSYLQYNNELALYLN